MSKNIINFIRCAKVLLDKETKDELYRMINDEFIPLVDLDDNSYVYCDNSVIMYTYTFNDGSGGRCYLTITSDRKIRVGINLDGSVNFPLITANFHLDDHKTEEDLFMLSTVQDNLGVEISDLSLFHSIWESYYETK